MKRLLCATAAIAVFLSGVTAFAASLNYDPNATPPAPVLNQGWSYDQINALLTDSADSPYIYNLAAPAIFRITDQFVVGDIYSVYDFGNLILVSAFNGAQAPVFPVGDAAGQAGWTDPTYSHGAVWLAAGPHDITVQGNGAGGLPAGFYDRIDSIPDGGATGLLLGGAVLGLAALRRKLN